MNLKFAKSPRSPGWSLWLALSLSALQGCGSDGGASSAAAWTVPNCVAVSGSTSVAISPNQGGGLIMPSAPPAATASEGVYFIVPLTGVPNRIIAYYNGLGSGVSVPPALYRSADSGCSWKRTTILSAQGSHLAEGDGTYAVGWTDTATSGSIVFVVDENGSLVQTTTFSGYTKGLISSLTDPNLIRRVGNDRTIKDSHNRGKSWTIVANVPSLIASIYTVAAKKSDLDSLVVGGLGGLVASNNGGLSWTTAVFDGDPTAKVTIQSAVFSADGNTIWARGTDADEASAGNPNGGKHLWESVDGGVNFLSVAEQTSTVFVGNYLIAHPGDSSRVFWSGGFVADPTTYLYQYSRTTAMVTRVQLSNGSPFFDVYRFAFNPVDPKYMYFGLVWP